MARGKIWTSEEIDILKEIYPDPTVEKKELLEALPSRSLKSIYAKAYELDIGRQWSDKEIDRLNDMYPDADVDRQDIIDAFPGRSWRAIRYKAHGFGLKRPKFNRGNRWTDEQVERLRVIFPDASISRDEIKDELGRSWDAGASTTGT